MKTTTAITGEFVFRPMHTVSLAEAICKSHLRNKEELLRMLFWSQLSDYDAYPVMRECSERDKGKANKELSHQFWSGMHLRTALRKQGDYDYCSHSYTPYPAKIQFEIFSHGRCFRSYATGRHRQPYWKDWQGYNETLKVLESRGCVAPGWLWFISFILQLPKDLLDSCLSIAAPLEPLFGDESRYFYYKSGYFGFGAITGDPKKGTDLTEMNQSLLFGVKSFQRLDRLTLEPKK